MIGATAKPLYAIDGKAGGLDRRVNPVCGDGGRELLPPPAGGPPPSRREVFGEGVRGNGGTGERASVFERGRRGIGATAKPLYAIDGKAGGLDRRVNPVRWR